MKIVGAGVLVFACRSLNVPASFTMRGAILRPDGTIDRIRQVCTCVTANAETRVSLPVNDGVILYLFGSGPGGLRAVGGGTAKAYLDYGTEGGGNSLGMIFSGVVTAEGGPSYGFGTQMVTQDLPCGIHIDTVGNPAAGAQFNWQPLSRHVEEVLWIRADLATDANVAVRRPGVRNQPPAGSGFYFYGGSTQAASLTYNWEWTQHAIAPTDVGNRRGLYLPPGLYVGASTVSSVCDQMQAGDQWSNITIAWRGTVI